MAIGALAMELSVTEKPIRPVPMSIGEIAVEIAGCPKRISVAAKSISKRQCPLEPRKCRHWRPEIPIGAVAMEIGASPIGISVRQWRWAERQWGKPGRRRVFPAGNGNRRPGDEYFPSADGLSRGANAYCRTSNAHCRAAMDIGGAPMGIGEAAMGKAEPPIRKARRRWTSAKRQWAFPRRQWSLPGLQCVSARLVTPATK